MLSTVTIRCAKVNALLVHLGRATSALASADRNHKHIKKNETFEQFRQLIEHHYIEHWSVSDYASQIGMTESKLYVLCKKMTDQTPSKIIQQRLLIEAKRNLVYTIKPINVIAYELGFQDPAYFSRFFNQQTGISARDFAAVIKSNDHLHSGIQMTSNTIGINIH